MTGAKILIVENEEIVALNIQARLEQLRYGITAIATSAEAAFQQIAVVRPDLVLMDIRLTGQNDGIQAAEQIRAQYNIPVVYLTAYADNQTLDQAKLTQPYGYILKPFETTTLVTAIEIALYKHQIDQQLREREQWLSTTLRSIGDAVITTDREGAITFMNPVAESLTGWQQSESLGCDLTQVFQIIEERTRQPIENPTRRALQDGITVGLGNDALLIARNGSEIPIDDCASPIKNDAGVITGAVLVFRNTSERRQVEAALHQLNERLESRVQERTEALQQVNQQLQIEITERQRAEAETRRALERERELNDLKSRFITTTSHEFRTPLAIILSSVQLLERAAAIWSEDRKLKYLQRIEEATKNIAAILDDVLMLSRTEAGRVECHPTQFNLEEFCRDLVENTYLQAGDHHQIHLNLHGDLSNVCLDETLLRHILTNLLNNAIKYSPNGGLVELEVERRPAIASDQSHDGSNNPPTAPSASLIFQVHDQGMGIPADDLPRLFDSFHRASNVGTIPGTGLGLAIVQNCVALQNGQVTVESEVGMGTLVTVTLPCLNCPSPPR